MPCRQLGLCTGRPNHFRSLLSHDHVVACVHNLPPLTMKPRVHSLRPISPRALAVCDVVQEFSRSAAAERASTVSLRFR